MEQSEKENLSDLRIHLEEEGVIFYFQCKQHHNIMLLMAILSVLENLVVNSTWTSRDGHLDNRAVFRICGLVKVLRM